MGATTLKRSLEPQFEGISLPGDVVDAQRNLVLLKEGTRLTSEKIKALGISVHHIDMDNSPRLPRHLIHTETGGIIVQQGTRIKMATRQLKLVDIAPHEIDAHASEPLAPEILQSVQELKISLEQILQNARGNIEKIQKRSIGAIDKNLQPLLQSGKLHIDPKSLSAEIGGLYNFIKSEDQFGGLIGTDFLRARGEVNFIEHGNTTMLYTLAFLKYLKNRADIFVSRENIIEGAASGLFHDVGMSFVPESILQSRTELSDEEKKIISRHPAFGGMILSQNGRFNTLQSKVGMYHHIPNPSHKFEDKESRIIMDAICIADTYSNLISEGRGKAEALIIMNIQREKLGKLYPHFHTMINNETAHPLFQKDSRIGIPERLLRNDVFGKLRLSGQGNHKYVAVMLEDSQKPQVQCRILDVTRGTTEAEQLVPGMDNVTLDFHSMITLEKKK